MRFNRYKIFILLIFAFLFISNSNGMAQGRNFPVREYTNPEELVTFDRSTSFSRALDVINQFAQKYHNKIIIDRTGTEGSIGISIPPMHWMDALDLIMRVKQLQLLESPDFYEIVIPQQQQAQQSGTTTGGTVGGSTAEEGPVATLDTRAVRINAIFFEGNRRALKEIGVDWSTLTENVPDAILGEEGAEVPSSEFDGPFVQVNSTAASNVSQSVFDAIVNVGEIGNTGIEVQALFSAFEADNLGEILASPTVKVLDGIEGKIQVGQDFSIKQRDFAGNVVEQFFSVGTILTVMPQIIEEEGQRFIHLTINAERSTAQPDPVSTIINKTEAETEALLLNGEATVIAGLYRTEQVQVRRGIPVLKDLPPWFFGLRYLFGFNSHDQLMRELVIIIQASIVPSIPERAKQDELLTEYEVLENERILYHNKVRESADVFTGESFADELEEIPLEENDTSIDPSDKQLPAKKDSVKVPEIEDLDEEQPPVITDPEVDNRVIDLDFDNDDLEKDSTLLQGDEPPVENKQQEKDNLANDASARFFVIGGSFTVNKNAVDLRNSLRKRGFDAVIISKEGAADVKLVAYRGYSSFEEARADLSEIRKNQNENAWIYKKQ